MRCVARFGGVELHEIDARHRALFREVYTSPAVMRLVCAAFSAERAEQTFQQALVQQQRRTRTEGVWAVAWRGQLAGLMGLQPCEQARTGELGTLLLDRFQGQGIALDAVEATVDLAFASPDWDALLVRHHCNNRGAAAVMRRVRMQVLPLIDPTTERVTWRLSKSAWPGPGSHHDASQPASATRDAEHSPARDQGIASP